MMNTLLTPVRPSRLMILFTLALAGAGGACQSKPAAPPVSANAWAVVNGREITRDDVEKAYQRIQQNSQAPSEEEAAAAKLEVLDQIIVQDLLLTKARELKIELPDTELDAAYVEARKNIPDDAFAQELAKRNLTVADMREGLRRDLLVQKLLEKEVTSKVTVTDQDVTAFFEANRAQFNRTEDAYRIAQIAITPVREARIANRTGNDAGTPQEAAAKVQMVMDRLKAGASFSERRSGLLGGSGVGAARRRPRVRAAVGAEPGPAAAARRRFEGHAGVGEGGRREWRLHRGPARGEGHGRPEGPEHARGEDRRSPRRCATAARDC